LHAKFLNELKYAIAPKPLIGLREIEGREIEKREREEKLEISLVW